MNFTWDRLVYNRPGQSWARAHFYCAQKKNKFNLNKIKKKKFQVRNPLLPQRALRKFEQDLKARAPESGTMTALARSGSEIFKCVPTSGPGPEVDQFYGEMGPEVII